MTGASWMIYGANGFTGRLISREARRRGLEPLLAGRSAESLRPLAEELGLPHKILSLTEPDSLARQLEDVSAVLHCAGPFAHTAAPMVDACLRAGCHYLDITGEVGVFESHFGRHRQAEEAGVVLLPGVGLDVVPTDCLAAHLHRRLPTATHLELALTAVGGHASHGTLVTMLEGLPHGGAERLDGRMVRRPVAFDARQIDFSCGRRWAMTIPWGDLSTAFRTTGIPNIRVYLGVPRRQIAWLRRLSPLLPLLGTATLQRAARWQIGRRVSGPDQQTRAAARSYFWGAARDDVGGHCTATLETPEGYDLTATTAVESLCRVLDGQLEPGTWTPARAFGAGFIREFPGVTADW